MSLATRILLSALGRLGPRPVARRAQARRALPAPKLAQGASLWSTLAKRQSARDFAADSLSERELAQLVWAAAGINRPAHHGRTAPSAMNSQEIDLYLACAEGVYRYDPEGHELILEVELDLRGMSGVQDFVEVAPLELLFVFDPARMKLVPSADRLRYAAAAAGAMAQNVYLACAALGLECVVRGWFDAEKLGQAMGLGAGQQVLLAQTVGKPPAS